MIKITARCAGIAMNIIPSIFNEKNLNYTILGNPNAPRKVLMDTSCVVLSRCDSHLKKIAFENIKKIGFKEVFCLVDESVSFNAINFTQEFPELYFVVVHDKTNIGSLINLGVSLSTGSHVLVLHDDLCLEKLIFTPEMETNLTGLNKYAVVPALSKGTFKMSTQFSPDVVKSVFNVKTVEKPKNHNKTLYPFDFTCFLNREKFMRLGGYDWTIDSPYWQNLDLSVRAWLWGEEIISLKYFTFTYGLDFPVEDRTADLSYLRFYLKNLLPVYNVDHASLPKRKFFAFKFRNGCGFAESIRQFKDARRWVEQNKYRFKTSAFLLVRNWDSVI